MQRKIMSQSKQSTKSKRICVNTFFSTVIIKAKSNSHIPIDEAYMHRRLPEVHHSPANLVAQQNAWVPLGQFLANCSLFFAFCAKYLVSGGTECITNFHMLSFQPGQRTYSSSLSPLSIEQGLTFSPGSFCPITIPPTPGQPCNLPGALDCPYEDHIDGLAGNCCCGQCDVDMTCAPDSTSGSGLWQPKHPMLCPTEGCGSEGEWWRENIKEVDPLLKVKLINC